MRLSFRQGIARYQSDINGNPIFLQKSGAYVDLVVAPDPTVLVFAHRTGTYVVEELKTVHNAWGPFAGSTTQYLYWDVNLLTGVLTHGFTSIPPLYTSDAPSSPVNDQNWFSTIDNVFQVWNGTKWVEKVRVFAGVFSSSSILQAYSTGSQVGLIGDFTGGHIVLDSYGMPLRQSNGLFVTTADWLNVVNLGTTTVSIEGQIVSGMASEYIPAYSAVMMTRGQRVQLGRCTDHRTRITGLVVEDLIEGEVQQVVTHGVVKNLTWFWSDDQIGHPVFCGPSGEVTTNAPTSGVVQQIGLVCDAASVVIDIKQPIILDDPDAVVPPDPSPPVGAPVASFTATPVAGTVPLQVQFTNTSTGGPDLVEWDFGNDGFVDTTTVDPLYVFAAPGVYTVRMRATNSFGFTESVQPNLITVNSPSSVPGLTNLGISFNAPIQVFGGTSFTLQVHVTNDGLLTATDVTRIIKVRASDGSAIAVPSSPVGTTVSTAGQVTTIALPVLPTMTSGSFVSAAINLVVSSTATAVQLEGTTMSPENDALIGDNVTNLTIGVRP